MKMTFKSFLAGFVACSLLLSSFTCVFAEEPLQVNDVTSQIQEDIDSTATLPNQPESVNEQESQQENEPDKNPDQSNGILDESDDTEINSVDTKQSQALDNEDSAVLTKDDTKDSEQPAEKEIAQIAIPVAEPAAGTYDEAQTVSLSCETNEASIYYTTDGTEPTENSHLYKEPILIESSKTIKAKAFLKDLPASDTLEAQYIINLQIDTKEIQSSESKLPELIDVIVNKETLIDGGTVTVSATAKAIEGRPVKSIQLIFVNTEDSDHLFEEEIKSDNGKFETEFSISQYEQSGVYQLQYVGVWDGYSEQQYCNWSIDPDVLQSYMIELNDSCKGLTDNISFTVNDSIIDTTAPEVKEVLFRTTDVTVPDKVEVSAKVIDDYSGVDSVEACIWNKEKDKHFRIELKKDTNSQNDGIYKGTSDALPTYTSSGTYFVGYIDAIDNLGNEQIYSLPDYVDKEESDQDLPGRASCRINNDQSDDVAPKILSISTDKDYVDVSNEADIHIKLEIEEKLSGLEDVGVEVVRIDGHWKDRKFCRLSFDNVGSARDGTYTCSFHFDKDDAPGIYQIDGISLSDHNDNHVKYSDSYSKSLPLPNNVTFQVINHVEPSKTDAVQSNIEYNIDAEENPDIWGDKTVNWYVPGTIYQDPDSNDLSDLLITKAFPKSDLYLPLGKDMSTLLKLSNEHFVRLDDLKVYYADDPFEFVVQKDENSNLIKDMQIVTEKKLDGKLDRTCYLKIELNDYTEIEEKTTTGTITLKAHKNSSDINNGSTFCEGDSVKFNYAITVSNKTVRNNRLVNLDDRICMQLSEDQQNTLTWSNNRAQIQFTPDSDTNLFYVYLTTRLNYSTYPVHNIKETDLWFYDFVDNPKIPSNSPATLILGKPWKNWDRRPSLDSVYIYQVSDDHQLIDVTKYFKYTKAKNGLIEGWTTSVNKLGSYVIAGHALLNTPSSGDDHSSGGHSGGGHSGGGGGGGGGGKGGGGGSGASANLVKAATVSKSATASVQTAINSAIKTKVKAATANIPITAGNEISPATVRSVVRAVNAASYKKGIAVTPQVTLSKMSAGKLVSKISFNPKLFTSKTNIKLGVALDDKASRTALSKQYKNKMQLVKFTQKGTFGMSVTVTANMNLTGMNTKTLQFFTYDRVKKTMTQIVAPNYSIDQQGYLHFTTNMGETVVITDSTILKK